MALIQRTAFNFVGSEQLLFDNYEIKENGQNDLEINNNGVNMITFKGESTNPNEIEIETDVIVKQDLSVSGNIIGNFNINSIKDSDNSSNISIDESDNITITTASTEQLSIGPFGRITARASLTVPTIDATTIDATTVSATTLSGQIDVIKNTDNSVSVKTDSDFIRFRTSSSEQMRIDSSGYVGIGTNNPSFNLDIQDTGSNVELRLFRTDGADFRLKSQDGQARITTEGDDIRFDRDNAGTNIMTLDGTNSDVTFSENILMGANKKIEASGYLSINSGSGVGMQFNTNGTVNNAVIINSLANVGIGTNTPSEKLDVEGFINSSNGYKIDGVPMIQYQKNTSSLTGGNWYRIAINGSMVNGGTGGTRISAKITLIDNGGGRHNTRTFYISCMFGRQPFFHLLQNSNYNDGSDYISKIRLVEDTLYEGHAIDVYVNGTPASNGITVVLQDDFEKFYEIELRGLTLVDFDLITSTTGFITHEFNVQDNSWGVWTDSISNTIVMNDDGNVGIGVTNPNLPLTIGSVGTGFSTRPSGSLTVWEKSIDGTILLDSRPGTDARYYTTTTATTDCHSFRKGASATTNNLFIRFYRNASSVASGSLEGDIRLNGSGNLAFVNASDERLKENIIDYSNGYNKVKSLRTVEFEWKDEQKKNEIGRVVGFIAQEVEKVLPKAVGTFIGDDDIEYKNISMDNMIPFNWSATRTLIKKVETAMERIEKLEAKIEELEKK